jgi:hypothetical protein
MSNPGSTEALQLGCKCPVMDNQYGEGSGYYSDDGTPAFWNNAECPLHGIKELKDD